MPFTKRGGREVKERKATTSYQSTWGCTQPSKALCQLTPRERAQAACHSVGLNYLASSPSLSSLRVIAAIHQGETVPVSLACPWFSVLRHTSPQRMSRSPWSSSRSSSSNYSSASKPAPRPVAKAVVDFLPSRQPTWPVGERIRVILDCDDNTLSFEKNYEFLGVAFRARSQDFLMWELCWTMPLVGWFSLGSPISPALSFRCCSITSITAMGSQHLSPGKRWLHYSVLQGTGISCEIHPITPHPAILQSMNGTTSEDLAMRVAQRGRSGRNLQYLEGREEGRSGGIGRDDICWALWLTLTTPEAAGGGRRAALRGLLEAAEEVEGLLVYGDPPELDGIVVCRWDFRGHQRRGAGELTPPLGGGAYLVIRGFMDPYLERRSATTSLRSCAREDSDFLLAGPSLIPAVAGRAVPPAQVQTSRCASWRGESLLRRLTGALSKVFEQTQGRKRESFSRLRIARVLFCRRARRLCRPGSCSDVISTCLARWVMEGSRLRGGESNSRVSWTVIAPLFWEHAQAILSKGLVLSTVVVSTGDVPYPSQGVLRLREVEVFPFGGDLQVLGAATANKYPSRHRVRSRGQAGC
ncbi:hypothetical protein PR048_031765 [Dryococelus australis]|uniref:SPRY domain-containing protein n=1 Tax=Dryococelus australis TaxID=614101 RepID=A0ABQ9G8U5_9NEOP|nr:hypothetical protein PR048_031765 [Dryococelus australis]